MFNKFELLLIFDAFTKLYNTLKEEYPEEKLEMYKMILDKAKRLVLEGSDND